MQTLSQQLDAGETYRVIDLANPTAWPAQPLPRAYQADYLAEAACAYDSGDGERALEALAAAAIDIAISLRMLAGRTAGGPR